MNFLPGLPHQKLREWGLKLLFLQTPQEVLGVWKGNWDAVTWRITGNVLLGLLLSLSDFRSVLPPYIVWYNGFGQSLFDIWLCSLLTV